MTKTQKSVEKVDETPLPAENANLPAADAQAQAETPAESAAPAKGVSLRVRNQGKPFDCDLTQFGYGMRWPTGAVYTIPVSKFMDLIKQGFDGTAVG